MDMFSRKKPIDRKYVRPSNSRDTMRWPYKGGYKGPTVYAHGFDEHDRAWERMPVPDPVIFATVSKKPVQKDNKRTIDDNQLKMGKKKKKKKKKNKEKKRKIYTGPRGGLYYKTKGKRVYIKQ